MYPPSANSLSKEAAGQVLETDGNTRTYSVYYTVIEQKGMTFDHDFLVILLFFFSLLLGGKRKGEKNNQSRG